MPGDEDDRDGDSPLIQFALNIHCPAVFRHCQCGFRPSHSSPIIRIAYCRIYRGLRFSRPYPAPETIAKPVTQQTPFDERERISRFSGFAMKIRNSNLSHLTLWRHPHSEIARASYPFSRYQWSVPNASVRTVEFHLTGLAVSGSISLAVTAM